MGQTRQRINIKLRPMHVADIPQVVALDHLCFTTPWPASSYRFELTQSRSSHMFVLVRPDEANPSPTAEPNSLLGFLDRMRFGVAPTDEHVVGFSGLWVLSDEVHISTIGVHPDWRGQQLGELLVFAMLRQAVRLGAHTTTLEVRVSNQAAQNLYHKYDFEITGRRKGYYRDNREDAWYMSVDCGGHDYITRLQTFGDKLFEQLDITDEWTA